MGCSAGPDINSATLPCLEGPNTLLKQLSSSNGSDIHGNAGSGGSSLRRSPLQLQTGGVVPLGIGWPHAAQSSNGHLLLTAAASVKCFMRAAGETTDSKWLDEDCAAPITAPPGQSFGRTFVLLDGLGNPVDSSIWDASMAMGVSCRYKRIDGMEFTMLFVMLLHLKQRRHTNSLLQSGATTNLFKQPLSTPSVLTSQLGYALYHAGYCPAPWHSQMQRLDTLTLLHYSTYWSTCVEGITQTTDHDFEST